MNIPNINGQEFVLCLHRFRSISVIITDREDVYGTPHLALQGPVSEETSVYAFHVGNNFHFAQNDTEITNRAKVPASEKTPSFKHAYVSKSALDVKVFIPVVSSLDILSCHSYRDAETAGKIPEISVCVDMKDGAPVDTIVNLNVLGADINIKDIGGVRGVLWGEGITRLTTENIKDISVAYKDTKKEDWGIH